MTSSKIDFCSVNYISVMCPSQWLYHSSAIHKGNRSCKFQDHTIPKSYDTREVSNTLTLLYTTTVEKRCMLEELTKLYCVKKALYHITETGYNC